MYIKIQNLGSPQEESFGMGVARVVVWQNARRESVGPCDEVRECCGRRKAGAKGERVNKSEYE